MTNVAPAPALLSREHLTSLGVEASPAGEIAATRENWDKLRTLQVKQVGGTSFPGIMAATPTVLAEAVATAEFILDRPGDDKLIFANPRSPNRDRTSFDVTDFTNCATFYL